MINKMKVSKNQEEEGLNPFDEDQYQEVDENGVQYQVDENGVKYQVDENGVQYQVDENGVPYYWDNETNQFVYY